MRVSASALLLALLLATACLVFGVLRVTASSPEQASALLNELASATEVLEAYFNNVEDAVNKPELGVELARVSVEARQQLTAAREACSKLRETIVAFRTAVSMLVVSDVAQANAVLPHSKADKELALIMHRAATRLQAVATPIVSTALQRELDEVEAQVRALFKFTAASETWLDWLMSLQGIGVCLCAIGLVGFLVYWRHESELQAQLRELCAVLEEKRRVLRRDDVTPAEQREVRELEEQKHAVQQSAQAAKLRMRSVVYLAVLGVVLVWLGWGGVQRLAGAPIPLSASTIDDVLAQMRGGAAHVREVHDAALQALQESSNAAAAIGRSSRYLGSSEPEGTASASPPSSGRAS